MATADKGTKSILNLEGMEKTPFPGYLVRDDNTYRWCPSGSCLNMSGSKVKFVALVESEEEACRLTGKDFTPSLRKDSFSKETLSELDKREKQIKTSITKIDTSFETIAFNLHWINTRQAYLSKGCVTIVDYSEKMFGYAKSTCYSLIGVVDRFAERDSDGHFTEKLSPLVKGYSVSKLSLMTGLTDDQIKNLKPEMSVREIKKYVKELEGKSLPALSEGDGEGNAPDESPEAGEENIIDSTAKDVTRNVLLTCKGSDDYSKKSSKIDGFVARVLKAHPDAVIEVSYTLP